jgi:hypothetical protein
VACSKNTKQFVFLILIRNLNLYQVFLLHRNSKFDDSFFQNFLKSNLFIWSQIFYVNWNFLKFSGFKITINFIWKVWKLKIAILSIMKRSTILLLYSASNSFYILNCKRGKIRHIYLTAMDELGWTSLISLFNLWLKLVTSFSPSY